MARSISTKTHGLCDYLLGALTVASPWLFGFADDRTDRDIALIIGSAILFYSAVTNYEASVIGILPFAIHRLLDLLVGILLATAFTHITPDAKAGIPFAILGVLLLLNLFFSRRPKDTAQS
jgi:hypothetical protein